MKKLFLACFMALLTAGQAQAQLETDDYAIFNHLGVGVGLGLNGFTIDVSTCLTPYVGVRAGVNLFPSVKFSTDLGLGLFGETPAGTIAGLALPAGDYAFEAKTKLTTGHLLFDAYPFQGSSFHVTAGAYIGASKVASMNNEEDGALMDAYEFNNRIGKYIGVPLTEAKIGAQMGDYFLEPDSRGNVEAAVKVNSFRPYIGIGFGRAVPKKRVGVQFDMGVQFWGTPKVYAYGLNGEQQLTEHNTSKSGGGDVVKTISKIAVYPNLSLRIVGRIL